MNNISFSIREGEIFTILGHNGAGKTTLIYMLTGMLSPNGGDAELYKLMLSEDIDRIQRNLGLC